jgi:hypothetical protein
MAQCAQPQPQEELPFFLSLIRLKMIKATIKISIMIAMNVPALADNQTAINDLL